MKDHATTKKHKRSRSSSNSSVFTISDDDIPKRKSHKVKRTLEEKETHKRNHKHHHKHRRHGSPNVLSEDDTQPRYNASEKNGKHKYPEPILAARVKEEPLSEDDREQKYKHRPYDDTFRKNASKHHREDFKRKPEHSDARNVDNRSRRPVKEELQGEPEPEWGRKEVKTEKKEPAKNNAKPDFGLSGKLTEDANTFNGVVIKYSEPPEARKPKRRWRLYPFKGETSLAVLHIHRQSAYLLGRDRKVADIPIDHPSCSKQHAVLQYRLVPFTRANGSSGRQIKLSVIDLESANGTFLNNKKIESKRYYELKERDVVKFGFSSREYVLLHEHSKDSENDDDVHNDE